MKFSCNLGFLLTALPLFTNAYPRFYPRIPDTLPAGTVRIGFDEETGLLIGFDINGQKTGEAVSADAPPAAAKRQAGSCQPLNVDDLKARAYIRY